MDADAQNICKRTKNPPLPPTTAPAHYGRNLAHPDNQAGRVLPFCLHAKKQHLASVEALQPSAFSLQPPASSLQPSSNSPLCPPSSLLSPLSSLLSAQSQVALHCVALRSGKADIEKWRDSSPSFPVLARHRRNQGFGDLISNHAGLAFSTASLPPSPSRSPKGFVFSRGADLDSAARRSR